MKHSIHHTKFFYLFFAITFAGVVWVLSAYISLIILALLFSVLIRPFYSYLMERFHWSSLVAISVTVFLSLMAIILPLLIMGGVITQEVLQLRSSFVYSPVPASNGINNTFSYINKTLGSIPGIEFTITTTTIQGWIKQFAAPTSSFLAGKLLSVGTSSLAFIARLFVFLVLVFFIVPILPKIKKTLLELSPLPDSIDKLYMDRGMAMTRAMIKGTFIVAVIQGVLAGLLLFIMGVPYTFLLTIIMILFAIIPILNTAIITIPIALFMILSGSVVKGIIIILIQTLVISSIDNILRPKLASGEGHMHPALLLLAILGGLNVFGFTGLIYGPLIVIFFTTSLEVYQKHYK